MGNLRQKYTDAEWYEMERKEEQDKRDGKPQDFGHIAVFIDRWKISDIQKLYDCIKEIEPNATSLWNIEKWLKWKIKSI